MTLPFTILPTDVRWTEWEPGHGARGELCSRCLTAIDEERDMAIRAWPADARYELRYHPRCLGFDSFEPEDDEEESDATTETKHG